MILLHDSRNPEYRQPLGARQAGEEVLLRLRVGGAAAARVYLRLWWDNAEQRFEMTAPNKDGLFEYKLKLPEKPGLLWYYFVAEAEGETLFCGNAADLLGGVGQSYPHEPPSFQLTVYDPEYAPPAWMGDGILYQIMVDRFYAREKRTPPHGWLHSSWHEPPALSIVPGSGDNSADDFFGGNLPGVEEKLPYLKRLGVTAIYFNPIFRAPSNHKYNTGSYAQIDPSFGTEAEFVRLCESARKMGIRIMLDGVFSHTGSDSEYFNREGHYGKGGAYQDPESPYRKWYTFHQWPEKYDCWWGFSTLPNVREEEESYQRYILTGENAIVPGWIRKGASGWRLDVADELPMSFLRTLRKQVKKADPEACVLGEVWEDASNKTAYDELRCYCLGDTLDSVMNYPLREGVIDFLTGKMNAHELKRRLDALYENYPAPFARSLMNLLGSHDKARIINRLSGATEENCPREQRKHVPLTERQYALGRARYLKAWEFICALPGMPCIYYGDEAGAQGEDDPFCRGTYPWGQEDVALVNAIARINHARLSSPVLLRGDMTLEAPDEHTLVVRRMLAGEKEYSYTLKA